MLQKDGVDAAADDDADAGDIDDVPEFPGKNYYFQFQFNYLHDKKIAIAIDAAVQNYATIEHMFNVLVR